MEAIAAEELSEVARLVEITSDAVALCDGSGTVLHVNRQFLHLVTADRGRVVGADIKDLLFSSAFARAEAHALPFTLDGQDNTLMLKLVDGSFIPVCVRALRMEGRDLPDGRHLPARLLITARSLEGQYAQDRQMHRLLAELKSANKRLSGTLSVIMSTVGSEDMPTLLDTVLNRLSDTLEADGADIYFSESGGFKLRGFSHELAHSYLPEFVPYGTGVATYVLREGRSCRFSIVPAQADDAVHDGAHAAGPGTSAHGSRGGHAAAGSFYDLDARTSHPLRIQDMPPFKTMLAVPVFFGTQVLGIIELGWTRPCTPRKNDLRVLEVICDYLSIELMSLVSTLRSQRTAELTRSLNRIHDAFFADSTRHRDRWRDMVAEVLSVLGCRLCPVLPDQMHGGYVIDFDGGSRVPLPDSAEELFFSEQAPAARVASTAADAIAGASPLGAASSDQLESVRIVRVDRSTRAGAWLADHGLPCQGVFVDMGPDLLGAAARAESDVKGSAGADGAVSEGATTALANRAPTSPVRLFLFLRDGSQEPIDDLEYDYLLHLAHDFELADRASRQHASEHRIAQTLQAGMRSELGVVPGITTDSQYLSATKQALVGGDFYTLIRLPDDQAVMILGDVSGKGVEAASMSALVKTALTAYAWEGASPAFMARSLNSMMLSFSRLETFATMFIAKLDLAHGVATYCSAGHPPTMLAHAGEIELLSVQSGVVGAFESMAYESGTFDFSPGDILFMYTDGAIEARDPDGVFFGEQRLRDQVLQGSRFGVEGLCQRVLDALDAFSHAALDDDIALVALRFDRGRA